MNPGKIVLIHIALFLLLYTVFFLFGEKNFNSMFPGIHGVETWLGLLLAGALLFFALITVSCIICLVIAQKKRSISLS